MAKASREKGIGKYPVAKKKPHRLEKHGHSRIDNYYWLRYREDPEVIQYLKSENEFLKRSLAHTEQLQKKLFREIKGRIKENDESVPYRLRDYFYYTRFEEGKEYGIYCRKKKSLKNTEQVILDANELAEGRKFYAISRLAVSCGQNLLAFGADTVGRRFYDIQFKNLDTGEFFADKIKDVTGEFTWAEDNQTLFYTKQDPETLRSFRVYRHVLGTDPETDQLVYEEKDPTFDLSVFKTKSRKFLVIASIQTVSTEFLYLDAANPEGEFKVFHARERDHEYFIDHFGDNFYIRTNYQAQNFRLMKTRIGHTSHRHWKEIIPHREDVFISDFEIFSRFLVIEEREKGLTHLRVRSWKDQSEFEVKFREPAYSAGLSANPEIDTELLRFEYTSLTTPNSVYDFNMKTGKRKLLKRDEVVGDFDPTDYVTKRLYATAQDGVQVPISLVHRKGLKKDGKNPLLLYGYGSYGITVDPTFSGPRLSLLERGFVVAVAHVRGGQIYGRQWYENGKLLKKKNTFSDFITCARFLISEGYSKSNRMIAQGGSAGGLLMGYVANTVPDLFKGIVAQVPFVDVLTSMLDPDMPLTTGEYDEWGDPNQKEFYDYMLSYSPYDQIKPMNYPAMLVTAGLHDSQVQYWEPAKWVAKLRAMKTDQNLIMLHTNLDAGHHGTTGRFKRLKQTALIYAFMLDQVGISK